MTNTFTEELRPQKFPMATQPGDKYIQNQNYRVMFALVNFLYLWWGNESLGASLISTHEKDKADQRFGKEQQMHYSTKIVQYFLGSFLSGSYDTDIYRRRLTSSPAVRWQCMSIQFWSPNIEIEGQRGKDDDLKHHLGVWQHSPFLNFSTFRFFHFRMRYLRHSFFGGVLRFLQSHIKCIYTICPRSLLPVYITKDTKIYLCTNVQILNIYQRQYQTSEMPSGSYISNASLPFHLYMDEGNASP